MCCFSNIKKKSNGNKKSKRSEESGADWEDSDDEEFSDLDDEEVSLGSMEEDDFEEDMDEEGGVFMDVSDDGNGPDKVTFHVKTTTNPREIF